MIKRRFITAAMCCFLSLLLTGCGGNGNTSSGGNAVSKVEGAMSEAASKAGDVVSRIGEDVSETISRVESFLEGDSSHTDSSRPDDDGLSSRHETDSRLDSDSSLPEEAGSSSGLS